MVKAILILAMCVMAFPVAGLVAMAGEPERELDYLLLGTVLHDSGEPMAIIRIGKAGEQELYRLGDVVEGGRLTKILNDKVTLTFSDMEVELSLTGGARSTPAAMAGITQRVQPRSSETNGGYSHAERATLDKLSRAPELNTQVTSLGPAGVRVDKVQADDLFHKLGLVQGDIISAVNGSIPGADASLQQAMVQAVMNEPVLRLEIERRGLMDLFYYELNP